MSRRALPFERARVRIADELGRGGMGVVYRATRERDGLPAALKTITPDREASRKQIDRFLRECHILCSGNKGRMPLAE